MGWGSGRIGELSARRHRRHLEILKNRNFDNTSKMFKCPYLQFPPIQNSNSWKIQKTIKIPHFYPLWEAYIIFCIEVMDSPGRYIWSLKLMVQASCQTGRVVGAPPNAVSVTWKFRFTSRLVAKHRLISISIFKFPLKFDILTHNWTSEKICSTRHTQHVYVSFWTPRKWLY